MAFGDWFGLKEKFIRWAIPYRERLLGYTTPQLTDGQTKDLLAETEVGHFGRITGTARSNRAVTINVYQGNSTGALNTLTTFTVAASAAAGAGTGFSVEVISKYVRIEAVNPAGAATTTIDVDAWGKTI